MFKLFCWKREVQFENYNFCTIIDYYAPVAQLDRATVFGTVGYRFDSYRAHFSTLFCSLCKLINKRLFDRFLTLNYFRL